MAVGNTASLYRHGRGTEGGSVYNFSTEQNISMEQIFEQGDQVINQTNLTVEARQSLTPAYIPTTTLANGDYIRARFAVPDGFTLKVWVAGVYNSDWNAPLDLDCWIYKRSVNSHAIISEDTRRVGNPITSVEGPEDVAFQIENRTGTEQNASGYFAHTLEPTETETTETTEG